MKNRKKLWLKLGLGLLIAGVILSGAGLAMGGLDALKSASEVRTGAYDAGEVNAVRIEATAAEVRLEKADGDRVEVISFEGNRQGVRATLEDGVLTLEQYDDRKWSDYVRLSWNSYLEIIVRVPGELAGAELTATSGGVTLEDVPVTGIASLSSTSGELQATGSAGTLALSTTSGDISAHDMEITGVLTAGTASGCVSLSNLTAGGAAKAASTSGDISVSDADARDFTLKSVSGKIRLAGADAAAGEGAISATTTSGGIEISDVSAAAFSFESLSGDVAGALPGSVRDYTIATSTTSGNNSLPEESYGGRGTIDVSTTSGDIELAFEE